MENLILIIVFFKCKKKQKKKQKWTWKKRDVQRRISKDVSPIDNFAIENRSYFRIARIRRGEF